MFVSYLELFIYIFCILVSMYGLSAFKFEEFIKKNKVSEVIVFYLIISMCLGYILAQLMFSFANIRL